MKNLYFLNHYITEPMTRLVDHLSNINLKSVMKFNVVLGLTWLIQSAVFGQSLTLLSPNGGENWMTGTTQTVSWQMDGEYADLYLEFSEDGGQYWYYIAYINAGDSLNEYTFTNYLYPTQQGLVRISLSDNENVFDESDDAFTVIENPVYFYTPYEGEKIYGGVNVNLSWYSYSIEIFNVDYSLDGGNSWTQIATSYSDNELAWTTPDTYSDQCLIKITDFNDSTNYGLSTIFSIVESPTAILLNPNGGEIWNYGSMATVSWIGTNLPYYLYIDYSTDGGQSWSYLGYGYGDETGGTTEVYVPHDPSENTLVRLIDPNYNILLDESDQPFTIYVPPVIMYNPYEGDEYYIKDASWISWLTTGIDEVNIALSTDGGINWITVEENVDADNGWYQWEIEGTPSTDCFIRVSDVSDESKFGLSGQFALLETPVIQLNNPVGNEIWNTDSTYTISWTYDNPDSYYVFVDYSVDNGQTWNYLGYGFNEDGHGSLDWKTPSTESEYSLVRVRDSYLDFVCDTSESFAIRTFPNTPICIVSVDSATNNNVIVWEKPLDDLIETFIIYKESDEMNIYEPIGTVSYSDAPVFIDTNSNPVVKSYRYKLGFSDSNNNVYPMSALHQTIHLSINKGVGDSWNLIWSDYLGFDVSSYSIYRSTNGSNYTNIATISSSFRSYTDVTAPNGEVYYFIEVINENGCNLPERNISNSISNIATNNILGIENPGMDLEVSIYPNPADNILNIRMEDENREFNIQLIDFTGNLQFNKMVVNNQGNKFYHIDVSEIPSGIYFLKIISENSGTTKKIIVKH